MSTQQQRGDRLWRRVSSAAAALAIGLAATRAAHAGPVSGTVLDTDYLKAQPGGFAGGQYPRYADGTGADAGQMVYPSNAGNLWFNENGYAFVLDSTTGATTPVRPVYSDAPANQNQDQGRFTYTFPYLPPGPHELILVEPYRGEVYRPSSKRITVTVSASDAAVTSADIGLVRQWRLSPLFTSGPRSGSVLAPTTASVSFFNRQLGWAAVTTDVNGDAALGDVRVFRTLDGGQNWTSASTFSGYYLDFTFFWRHNAMYLLPHSIHFTDPLHGTMLYVMDWQTLVFFIYHVVQVVTTDDGGQTWQRGPQLFLSHSFNGFDGIDTSADVSWDPSDPNRGVLYGTFDVLDSNNQVTGETFAHTTTDGGRTWTPAFTTGATSAATGGSSVIVGGVRLFTFAGGDYSLIAAPGWGVFGYSPLVTTASSLGATDWAPLNDADTGTRLNGLIENSAATAGRAAGRTALAQLQDPVAGLNHTYRTDDGGLNWRQISTFYGSDTYSGSLSYSQNYLWPNYDLMPDEQGVWLWTTSLEGAARSMDAWYSQSFTGKVAQSVGGQNAPLCFQNPLDTDTGRCAVTLQGTNAVGGAALVFGFDAETPTGPARIVPVVQFTSDHFNAGPGLYVNLVNAGGDWAREVTIDSVTATGGAVFDSPRPLSWNLGAIPPGSTTNQAFDFRDRGLVYFTLRAGTAPSGQRYSVTITGHYNGGQQFRTTLYLRG